VLGFTIGRKIFCSDLWPAANDGGQRMDSSRYWNTVRNREDFRNTRDLWHLGSMRVVDFVPGQYHYALGDASHAYSREKLKTFTREIVYVPAQDLLFVFDRVVSTHPEFKKAWLLHGVNPPRVDMDAGQEQAKTSSKPQPSASKTVPARCWYILFAAGARINPARRPRRGLHAPGDDHGGAWGSGENWPPRTARGRSIAGGSQGPPHVEDFLGRRFRSNPEFQSQERGARRMADRSISFRSSEEDLFLHVWRSETSENRGQGGQNWWKAPISWAPLPRAARSCFSAPRGPYAVLARFPCPTWRAIH